MKLSDLAVEVRDKDLTRIGVIPYGDLDVQFKVIHNNVGVYTLKINAENPLLPALRTPGTGLIITVKGQTMLSGPIVKQTYQATSTDPLGTWQFEGVSDDIIFADRLAWPQPSNPNVETQNVAEDKRTGAAETVIHGYVNANIGPAAPMPRRVPTLTMGPDGGRGPSVTKSARFPMLGELINDIAILAGLGFRLIQRGTGLVFETYEVVDRTHEIRLDVRNNTLTAQKLMVSAPEITEVIVGGATSGTSRTYRMYNDADSLSAETAWNRRIERFEDARSGSTEAELQQAGAERLAEKGETGIAIQAVPMDGETMQLGRDWNVGDKVAVVVDTEELSAIVTAVAIRADSDGLTISTEIGDPAGFNPNLALRRRVQETGKRLSALERNP